MNSDMPPAFLGIILHNCRSICHIDTLNTAQSNVLGGGVEIFIELLDFCGMEMK